LTKQGKINNVLLSQTITLGLNIRISSSLPGFELKEGVLVTAPPDGPCGTTTPQEHKCTYDPITHVKSGDNYVYRTITADVIAALDMAKYAHTVDGLLKLANDALGNTDGIIGSEYGAPLSAINSAVDAINNAFDGCRIFIDWNVEPCAERDPAYPIISDISSMARMGVISEAEQTLVTGISVKAYPNPYNDRVQFNIESSVSGKGSLVVYNLLGQKVKTVYEGYIFAGKGHVVEFRVPALSRTSLIYIFTINGKQRTGKLINQR
jgi:hypothetical protein